MTSKECLEKIRGKLIVSCQGYADAGSPFWRAEDQAKMAEAAFNGGCSGFRLNSPEHINLVKEKFPDMPVIGIHKIHTEGNDVYITPTMEEVDALAQTKCEIIAIDGTKRLNRNGDPAYLTIKEGKKKYPDRLFMADCATFEEMCDCIKAGADIVASTLSGYTEETDYIDDRPNFNLIRRMRKENKDIFIIMEGKIHSPEDVKHAFECGADAVVCGNLITGPHKTTRRFINYLNEQGYDQTRK